MSVREIKPVVIGTMEHGVFTIRVESYAQFVHDKVLLQLKNLGKTALIEVDPRKNVSYDNISAAEFNHLQTGLPPYFEINKDSKVGLIEDINFLLDRVRKWHSYPHKYNIKHFSQM